MWIFFKILIYVQNLWQQCIKSYIQKFSSFHLKLTIAKIKKIKRFQQIKGIEKIKIFTSLNSQLILYKIQNQYMKLFFYIHKIKNQQMNSSNNLVLKFITKLNLVCISELNLKEEEINGFLRFNYSSYYVQYLFQKHFKIQQNNQGLIMNQILIEIIQQYIIIQNCKAFLHPSYKAQMTLIRLSTISIQFLVYLLSCLS
ncbi:hypothetical protein TTHERM_000145409 (macronuclear) [Tetrahymena thermophila SB210]|uniref:Uncharacterized protein n=1 Tax=Tetrahymena thermophila (strain SB210) TaxID=312017 RepID=W7XFN6_TETTS|nr:hypothetical protein TTHERM_000145409 [Tetrahymena thermophila SB210]EWS75663.1 hypothetical protein TTHERM_000145409 [Tetrahymena thermophila SB210]|eukprot:XP_012651809.1 hypothetical protein TTHERM_000145409 [Tetrahymena thermophila SB210]